MKKILMLILSVLIVFTITGFNKEDNILNQDITGDFEIIEGFTDATITLRFDNPEVFGNKTITIVVEEKLNKVNKVEKIFTKETQNYKFENLTQGTTYEALLYLSGEILNVKISTKDFTTKTKAIEGNLLLENVKDTTMTVVVTIFEEDLLTTEDVKITLTDGIDLIAKEFVKGTTDYVFKGLKPLTEYTAIFLYNGNLKNNVAHIQETTKNVGVVELSGAIILENSTQTELEIGLFLNNFDIITDSSLVTIELRDEYNFIVRTPIQIETAFISYYKFNNLTIDTTYNIFLKSTDPMVTTNIKFETKTEGLPILDIKVNIKVDNDLTTNNSATVIVNILGSLEGTTATLSIVKLDGDYTTLSKSITYIEGITTYTFNDLESLTNYVILFTVKDANIDSTIYVDSNSFKTL